MRDDGDMTLLRHVLRLLFLPGRLLIGWFDRRRGENEVGPLNTFQQGSVHVFVGFCVFALLAGSTSTPPRTPTSATVASGTVATTPVTTTRLPQRIPQAPPMGEHVTVARVIDGDTFELTDGRKVRVLGIDSCEKDTPGGESATVNATTLLTGREPVYLLTEPGVTTDRYGRYLRYVQAGPEDFGMSMVKHDHTGVYQGDNDASAKYIARLYEYDLAYAVNPPAGRDCGEALLATEPDSDPGPVYVPDNDDDDDHESRFCRKRWWC
jgi:endonuclease YncB( thermonuclease family)